MVPYLMKKLAILVACLMLVSCADPKSAFQATDTFTCEAPDATKRDTLWGQQTQASSLIVSTVDKNFQAAMIRSVDLLRGTVLKAQSPGTSDSFVRADENNVYVINRLQNDSIQILEREGLKYVDEKHDEALSNPSDLVVVGDSLYLSRYEKKTLRRYSVSGLQLEKEYDLSKFADDDGIPEAQWMLRDGKKIYIELQKLSRDPNSPLMLPKGPGAVAVLDTETDALEDKAISLLGGNPVTEFKVDPSNQIYVGTMGNYAKLDGGIERLGADEFIVTEEQLGGDIVDFTWIDATRLVVIVRTLPPVKTQLLLVSTEGSFRKQLVMESQSDFYQGLHSVKYVANCGAIFVSDRDTENPKIIPISTDTMRAVEDRYFDVGLAPYHMVLAP